jgi:hypothetical protein
MCSIQANSINFIVPQGRVVAGLTVTTQTKHVTANNLYTTVSFSLALSRSLPLSVVETRRSVHSDPVGGHAARHRVGHEVPV